MRDLAFVVTCIDDSHIYEFLDSVYAHSGDMRCVVMLLAQNSLELNTLKYRSNNVDLRVSGVDKLLPLSVARNRLLREYGYDDARYYMFPDDDSTFDDAFFRCFSSKIVGNSLIEVRTVEDKNRYYLRLPERDMAGCGDYNYVASVNLVVKNDTLRKVEGFDEELGVGCYYGAGEDNDFFLRSQAIEPFMFCKGLYSMHPSQRGHESPLEVDVLKRRYMSYGRGVVWALCKNGFLGAALKVCIRGYLGAAKSFIFGRWKMAIVYWAAAVERTKTWIKYIVRR